MNDTIEIRVNGEERSVPSGTSIQALLHSLDLQPAMIVVEYNGDIIRRDSYPAVRLGEGDALELVHFVGGG